MPLDAPALGIGYYRVAEASRLLRTPARKINRWLGGYAYLRDGKRYQMPPLWTPQLARHEHHIELGFRDLIELRFVKAFLDAGLGLKTIRHCLEYARAAVEDERPFATRRFRTDGRTIFLESAHAWGGVELLDLKSRQYAIQKVIERSFKDVDLEGDVVIRWRPYKGRESIVIDPERVFGQPIAADYGVPTIALAQAVFAEGSVKRVSQLYEIPASVVRDAVAFEGSLATA